MPTLAQITKSDNLIENILTAPELAGFDITKLAKLLTNPNKERIFIGPMDNGDEFDIDALIEARNAPTTIIVFSHSNPSPTVRRIEGETEEEWEVRQADYLTKLYDNFGIEEFVDGEEYYFYSHVEIVAPNPFYSVGTEFDVAQTHSCRIALRSGATIYAIDNGRAPGPTNWHFASWTEPSKGDVYYWNAGHFAYDHEDITSIVGNERDILVGTLS